MNAATVHSRADAGGGPGAEMLPPSPEAASAGSDGLDDLYHAAILDLGRDVSHRGRLEAATHSAEARNPLCGDRVRLELVLADDGQIAAARFEAKGCTLSLAAAALVCRLVEGMSIEQARALKSALDGIIGADGGLGAADAASEAAKAQLGVFAGVRAYPMRRSCASLPFGALMNALGQMPAQLAAGPMRSGSKET